MKETYHNNRGIDVPLESNENKTTVIPSNKVNNFEEKLERQAQILDKIDKHFYKLQAFRLLIGCGIAYLVLVILEMIIINAFSWNTGELMNSFVELLKFVISTLIGYVFSETQKHKDK